MPCTLPLRRRSWNNKPPLGYVVDSNHHLAWGVGPCYLFNEAASRPSGAIARGVKDSAGGLYDASIGGNTVTAGFLRGYAGRTAVGGLDVQLVAGNSGCVTTSGITCNGASVPFTLEAWIKPRTFTELGTILADSSATRGWWIATTGAISANFGSKSNGTVAMTAGVWNHIAVVCNRTRTAAGVEHYLNGKRTDNLSGNAVVSCTFLYIGNDNSSETFDGYIDLIRVWPTRALTASEIWELYTDPYGMFEGERPRSNIRVKGATTTGGLALQADNTGSLLLQDDSQLLLQSAP